MVLVLILYRIMNLYAFSVRMRVFAVDPSLKPHMTGIDLKIMVYL